MRARNVGVGPNPVGKFWGAARISGLEQKGVDRINYGVDPEPPLNFCDLTGNGILVPAHTDPPIVKILEFATGGAAELPVNFCISERTF